MRLQGTGAPAVCFARLQRRSEAPKSNFLSDCTHSHNPPVAGALGWWSVDVVARARSPPWKDAGEVALKPLRMACQLAQLDLQYHGGANVQVRG